MTKFGGVTQVHIPTSLFLWLSISSKTNFFEDRKINDPGPCHSTKFFRKGEPLYWGKGTEILFPELFSFDLRLFPCTKQTWARSPLCLNVFPKESGRSGWETFSVDRHPTKGLHRYNDGMSVRLLSLRPVPRAPWVRPREVPRARGVAAGSDSCGRCLRRGYPESNV